MFDLVRPSDQLWPALDLRAVLKIGSITKNKHSEISSLKDTFWLFFLIRKTNYRAPESNCSHHRVLFNLYS